jgi:hypothetical protein
MKNQISKLVFCAFTATIAFSCEKETTSPTAITAPTWITYNADTMGLVRTISIDAQGNKWFGTQDDGVLKFDGTHWTKYNTYNSGLPNNWVLSIAFDAKGNKWFGTEEGVSKFDGTHWTAYTDKYWINAIAIDAQGNKWFGTEEGVLKFNGINWTTYANTSGFSDNWVNDIAIDAQDIKWVVGGVCPNLMAKTGSHIQIPMALLVIRSMPLQLMSKEINGSEQLEAYRNSMAQIGQPIIQAIVDWLVMLSMPLLLITRVINGLERTKGYRN